MVAPKQISERTLLGQLGVNIVERTLLEMGLVLYPTGQVEAGIDGFVELRDRNTGVVSNFFIAVQVKATQQDFPNETPATFEWPCSERDLDYWLQGNAPMVLIVVRPRTDEAYWVPLKQYFNDLSAKAKRRILFDKARNAFSNSCREEFVRLAVPRDVGIYRHPAPKPEKLYLNLIRVTPPESLYVATTEYPDSRELASVLKADGKKTDLEWLIRGKRIISVHDLSEEPFRSYCDLGTVECHSRVEWERDVERRRELTELLNLCLRQSGKQHGLWYNPLRKRLFFASPNGRSRRLDYHGLRSGTSREVVKPVRWKKDPALLAYCRHSAMEWQFRFLNGGWLLEITPTYHFTRNGKDPDPFCEERIKRLKEKEKNAAVFGQVLMWADLLARSSTLFSEAYPHIRFGLLETLDLDFGINDQIWLEREDAQDRQAAQSEMEFL